MKYPKMEYKVSQSSKGIVLKFKTDKELLEGVEVWQTQTDNKDFRKCEFKPTKVNGVAHSKRFKVTVDYPQSGFKAFVVILKYRHPSKPNATYNITTRMFTADSRNIRGEKLNNPRDSDDSRSVKNFIVDAMNFEHTYSVFFASDDAFLMEVNLSISVAEARTKTYLNAFITLAF